MALFTAEVKPSSESEAGERCTTGAAPSPVLAVMCSAKSCSAEFSPRASAASSAKPIRVSHVTPARCPTTSRGMINTLGTSEVERKANVPNAIRPEPATLTESVTAAAAATSRQAAPASLMRVLPEKERVSTSPMPTRPSPRRHHSSGESTLSRVSNSGETVNRTDSTRRPRVADKLTRDSLRLSRRLLL